MLWPEKIITLGFAALFSIVPLIFLPYTSELFEFNKIIITAVIAIAILFGWGSRCVLEKRLIFKRTYLDIPLLLFLITQLFSFIFSIDPQTSLLGYYGRWNGGLLSLAMYSLLYWAFVSNMDKTSTKRTITYCLLPTALFISLYGILQHFGVDDHLWVQDVKNRVFSTLGQPNWLAAYLVALIFIPIAKFLNTKSEDPKITYFKNLELTSLLDHRILNFGFVVILFTCLLFTKSRSGLLAFAISSIVFAIFYIRSIDLKLLPKNKILGLLLFLFTLTILFPNPIRDLIYRPIVPTVQVSPGTALETGGTESGIIRQIVWKGAINVWLDNPKTFLLGTGPETFALSYFLHRPIEHNNTSEWELLYNKAHNEFLNYLSTTGLLGLGAYLLLLLTMFLVFIKNLKLGNSPEIANWKLLIPAILAGWLSLSVTNFWGFSVVVPQLLLFIMPAFAVSLKQEESKYKPQKLAHNLTVISAIGLICLVCLIGLYNLAKYWLADFHYSSSQKAENAFLQTEETDHIINGYESAKTAYDLNPQEPVINLQLSTMAAYLSLVAMQVDTTASAQFSQLAVESSKRAIDLSPNSPSLRKSQARTMILLSTVDPIYLESATDSLKSAQKLSPTDPRIPYNLGLVSQFMQATDSAKSYYESALKLKPDFIDAKEKLTELASPSAKIDEN